MIWTDQMQLTPERLNDLQKRADSQAFVVFDINKGFWGSQVQEAIDNEKIVLIKISEDFTSYQFLRRYQYQNDYYFIVFGKQGDRFKQASNAENNMWQEDNFS